MKYRFRIVSMLLVVIMIISACPLPTFATENPAGIEIPTNTNVVQNAQTPILQSETTTPATMSDKALGSGEKTFEELQTMTLDPSTLPEMIPLAQANEKGHVNRLREQEDGLNTVTFQNRNGSKTAYIYNKPVKYVDSAGVIHDKSTALTSQTNSYAMLNNSVKAHFFKNLSEGVRVTYGEYAITMRPYGTTLLTIPVPTVQDNTVLYPNAFGLGTILSYTTQQNGVKEDIILVKNTGENTFCFTVTLDNLIPEYANGIWYLKDSTGRFVADFGEVVVWDSDGHIVQGTMTIEQQFNHYLLTITVPEEFLQADSTVYPVYIDPTTTIYEEEILHYYDDEGNDYYDYYDAIEDIGVYTGEDHYEDAVNDLTTHRIGNNSEGHTGIIYKLYDFYGAYGQFLNMDYCDIGNVTLYLRTGMGDSMNLTAYPMYKNLESLSDPVLSECVLTSYFELYDDCHTYGISSTVYFDANMEQVPVDITDVVKSWAKYNAGDYSGYNPQYGLLIQSDGVANELRIVYATESSAYNDAYYTIEYNGLGGKYYVYNDATASFMKSPTVPPESDATEHTKVIHTIYKPEYAEQMQFIFEYVGEQKFIIRHSANPSYILGMTDDWVTFETLASNIPITGQYLWTLESKVNGYIIQNVSQSDLLIYCGDNTDVHLVEDTDPEDVENGEIWQFIFYSNFIYQESFSVTQDWLAVGASRASVVETDPTTVLLYENASRFTWQSDNEAVAQVSADGTVTGISNGTATITVTHRPTGVSTTFAVSVGQIIPNGTYYIMNKSVKRYLDVEGPSTSSGANIQIWDWHGDVQSKWNISYLGDGYYSIQSVLSSLYVGVSYDPMGGYANIKQLSSLSNLSKWKIVKTNSGACKLIPKADERYGYCLGISQDFNFNGLDCKQIPYSNDSIHNDEWYLSNVNYCIQLVVKTDEAYRAYRFGDNNDTTRIDAYLNKMREKFAEYFFICVVYSEIDHSYSSLADTCPSAYNEPCNCSGIPNNHKDLDAIASACRSDEVQSGALAILLFTGHWIEEDGEEMVSWGKSILNRNPAVGSADFAIVKCSYDLPCDNDGKYENDREGTTAMHEIGHFFGGSLDHYYKIDSYRDFCIYGYQKGNNSVREQYTICANCKAAIQAGASRYSN